MGDHRQPPKYSGSSAPPTYEQSQAQARASGQAGREHVQEAAEEQNESVVSYNTYGEVNASRNARRMWADTRLTMAYLAAATPSQAPVEHLTPGRPQADLAIQQNAHERAIRTARAVLKEQGQPTVTQASQSAPGSAAGSTPRHEATERTEGSERALDTVRLFMGERGTLPSHAPEIWPTGTRHNGSDAGDDQEDVQGRPS